MSVASKDERYFDYLEMMNKDFDVSEEHDMCEVYDYIENKGVEKGRKLERKAMEKEIREERAARKEAERRVKELEKKLELLNKSIISKM